MQWVDTAEGQSGDQTLFCITFARHPFNSPLSELKIQELSFLISKSHPIKIVMTIAAIEQKRLLHTDAVHCATPALRDTSDTLIRSNDQMLSSICMWQWAFPLVKMVWCGLLTLQLPPPSSPSTSWPHLLVSPDGLMWPSVASTTRLSITFAIIQQTHIFAGFRQTSKVHIFSLLFKGSKFRAGINKYPRYICKSLFLSIQTLATASLWTCCSSWQNPFLFRSKSFKTSDPLSFLFTRPRGRHNLVQPPPIPYPWSETWYALFSPPSMGWRNDARAVSSLRIHNKFSLVRWMKSTLWISRTYKLQNIFSYPWKVALAVLKSPIIT